MSSLKLSCYPRVTQLVSDNAKKNWPTKSDQVFINFFLFWASTSEVFNPNACDGV